MSSRVAVVTGSNKGIGFAVVKQLCQRFDGDVYLTARDVNRGQEAVKKLQQEFNVNPKFHQLDIDDQDSIIAFRNHLQEEYGGLDVLVNNAAIAYKQDSTAPFTEQAVNTLKTNFHSTQAACDVLFSILKPHARVVNVSSSAGMLKRLPNEELRHKLCSPTLSRDLLNNLAQQYVDDVYQGNLVIEWHR